MIKSDKTKKFIEENFKTYFNISISNVHDSIYGITTGYYEALFAMEKGQDEGTNITLYRDIIPSESPYAFSIEAEQKLINYIKDGDYERASASMEEVFQQFEASGLAAGLLLCFKFDVLGTYLKAISGYGCESIIMQLGATISVSYSINETKVELLNYLQQVCSYMKEYGMQHKGDKLHTKVHAYLEQNYSNINLNVAMVADHFNKSRFYLSSQFKEQTGENLKDVISGYRIQKAKGLLQNSELSIVQISERVGFVDSNTFIRVFKKFEGITPGKYREL